MVCTRCYIVFYTHYVSHSIGCQVFFCGKLKKLFFSSCAGIGNQEEGNQRPGLSGARPGAVVNGAVQAPGLRQAAEFSFDQRETAINVP